MWRPCWRRTGAPVDGFDGMPPRDKLRAIVSNLVDRMAQSPVNAWEMRLVSRELFIPTFAQAEFVATSIEPRRALLKGVIGEIIGRPPEDPQVGRCTLTVIAPCLMISIVSRPTLEGFLPDIADGGAGRQALVDHVVRFVLAGLEAVVQDNLNQKG